MHGLLDKIVNILGLDHNHIRTLVTEDRRRFTEAWERWASEPVQPQLRFRVIPAIWCSASLPEHLAREEAVAYASSRAAERQLTYVLIWSRKEEVWCRPDGSTHARIMDVGELAQTEPLLEQLAAAQRARG